jgi:hypothetical protein
MTNEKVSGCEVLLAATGQMAHIKQRKWYTLPDDVLIYVFVQAESRHGPNRRYDREYDYRS